VVVDVGEIDMRAFEVWEDFPVKQYNIFQYMYIGSIEAQHELTAICEKIP
jgi:hypothetical protein